MNIKQKIFSFIAALLSKELSVVAIAMLPVFELRLAIPVAILYFKMAWHEAILLSLLGNILVILPLLIFFKYFFHKLEYLPLIGGIFKWWFSRVEHKSQIVRRWGFWGLVCFVAIPMPGTGAWTGSVAATLIEMPTRKAFLAICAGVIIAGAIITILSVMTPELFSALLKFIK
jgi:uncharacterized membrane protein